MPMFIHMVKNIRGQTELFTIDVIAGILIILGGVLVIFGSVNLGSLFASLGLIVEIIKSLVGGGI